MSYSLDSFRPTSSRLMLTHPTDGPTNVWIDVVGSDSKPFREKSKQLMKSRIASKDAPVDVDQLEKDNADLAATCIVGWDESVFGPFSAQQARIYMSDPELNWIREQVEAYVKDRTNFFRRTEATAE